MPTLVDELSHLRAADDHLRTAVYLISAQENLLARYRAARLDTRVPEQLLSTMQAILRSFIAHRLAICEAIELQRQILGSMTQPWPAPADHLVRKRTTGRSTQETSQ
ncbi:hypothetical protein [Paraburkholderia atlantica]|uniref:hypothetical protein n=1 Tax=Paraburkholderia atlantica TaxID=2654982 RepID=UPI00160B8CF9|nr:hypothetical protein [Paraburkholderia atlantica]MBB5511001.1 hypothetical protein [Paraburkholderia atlantica]